VRFASLGSGSRGNGTLVEHAGTCVLVDCGFTLRDTERRLARLGKDAASLSAILITHEHTDHISGVAALARKHALPVWMTPGTWSVKHFGDLPVHFFNSHASFILGDLQIHPFPVPHDAREPSQFVFTDGVRRLGILTDTGCSTPHIEQMLAACDALLLECNHDSTMLANGPYNASLKQRVGGALGHLSNQQAAQLLTRIKHQGLQHIVAAHLSEKNNTPARVSAALSAALNCRPDEIAIAEQDAGLDWRTLQ
jgi:phosphoribosyl 1,2-cyclic phosphodiesterase